MTVADIETQNADGGRVPRARSVSFVIFTLRLLEPGGVTVPGEGPDLAQVVLDTGIDGRAQLPGTSLAGALREMVRGQRGTGVADDWFGRIVAGAEADAQASRMPVRGGSGPPPRSAGSAAPRGKTRCAPRRCSRPGAGSRCSCAGTTPPTARSGIWLCWWQRGGR